MFQINGITKAPEAAKYLDWKSKSLGVSCK